MLLLVQSSYLSIDSFFYSVASLVNRRPQDRKRGFCRSLAPLFSTAADTCGLCSPCGPFLSSRRIVAAGLQPLQLVRAIIALHLDQCPGHSMAVATCTAPRAVPVRPSRASYSSLSQEQWPVANMATKRPYQACTSLMDAAIWAGPLERVRSSCLLELCPFSLLCDHCGRSCARDS